VDALQKSEKNWLAEMNSHGSKHSYNFCFRAPFHFRERLNFLAAILRCVTARNSFAQNGFAFN
jgi:hypothetical protein